MIGEGLIMIELRKDEMYIIKDLFKDMNDTVILSCLEGHMGRGFTDDKKVASVGLIYLGSFLFIAGGDVSLDVLEFISKIMIEVNEDTLYIISNNPNNGRLLEQYYKENYKKINRYQVVGKDFDLLKLEEIIRGLPKEYEIRQIDEDLYKQALEENWSSYFVNNFDSAKDFTNRGIGYVILDNETIVSGASSYSIYNKGVEIEIATREEYRNRGLAYIIGAKLILECTKRGLYPSWDAANLTSVGLATRLGYKYVGPYDTHRITNE